MKRLIDLHVHLDGSLPYETVHKLMQQAGMPAKTDAELYPLLSVPEDCRDLNEYLEKFDFPLQLMQSAGNIEQIVYDLLNVQRAGPRVYGDPFRTAAPLSAGAHAGGGGRGGRGGASSLREGAVQLYLHGDDAGASCRSHPLCDAWRW